MRLAVALSDHVQFSRLRFIDLRLDDTHRERTEAVAWRMWLCARCSRVHRGPQGGRPRCAQRGAFRLPCLLLCFYDLA